MDLEIPTDTTDCGSASQKMTPANPSAFYEYTKALCQSFLFSSLSKDELSQISILSPGESFCSNKLDDKKLVDILITLAGEFDRRFSQPSTMEQTMRQLDLSEDNLDNIRNVYIEVLNGMFRKLNWGRIVAMLAFLRMLAMYLLKRGRRRDVDDLIESTAMYCDGKLRIWIQRHGGWQGLVDFFCGSSLRPESSPSTASKSVPEIESESKMTLGSIAMAAAATGAFGAIGLAGLCALWSLRR